MPRAVERTDPGPPRGVITADGAPGPIEHRRVAPTAALAGSIAHFWWVRWRLTAPFVVATLPHPCVHLTIEPGRAEVGGVATRRFERRLVGDGWVFGVKFRPGGFRPLASGPVSRMTDRALAIDAVFGAAGTALAAAITAAAEPVGQVALAEAFFAPRVAPLAPAIAQIRDVAERLARDPELVRVADVAVVAALTPRTLERRFRDYVGVGPKWVLRRYRLHEAAERLKAPSPPSLATLAAALGYADQAHFARDFKAAIGCTPRAFSARARVG